MKIFFSGLLKKFIAALIILCSFIKANAQTAEEYYDMALKAKTGYNHTKAIEYLNKAISMDAKGKYYWLRGDCKIEHSGGWDPKGAVSDYTQAITLLKYDNIASTMFQLHFGRAQAYYWSGDSKNAFPDFDKALEFGKGDAEFFFLRARAYAENKDYKNSSSNYMKMVTDFPGDSAYLHSAYIGLAKAYTSFENYTEAANWYSKAISISETKYTRFKNDDIVTSEIYHADLQNEYKNRAYVYYKTGNLQKAISDQKKAISLSDPKYLFRLKDDKLYHTLGNYQYYNAEYAAALHSYDKAISLQGKDKDYRAYSSKADVYIAMYDYPNAIKLIDQALSILSKEENNETGSELMLKKALCYRHQLNYSQALAIITEAQKYGNPFENKKFDLLLELTDGCINAVIRNCEANEKLLNNNAVYEISEYLAIQAKAYLKKADYKLAVEKYKAALRQDTGWKYINYYIASVYKQFLKDDVNARKYFKEFLKICTLNDNPYYYGATQLMMANKTESQKAVNVMLKNENYIGLAKYYSLALEPQKTNEYLKKLLDKGFKNYDEILDAEELETYLKTAGFGELRKKYFPEINSSGRDKNCL